MVTMNKELKERLNSANSLDEVKEILKDYPGFDAEKVYKEIENHRSKESEKLDLNELDVVSGGADRDWKKDGCAATCEEGSWCWSNDRCQIWDVTYSDFWVCCPDGHAHEFDASHRCVRCGHISPYSDYSDN